MTPPSPENASGLRVRAEAAAVFCSRDGAPERRLGFQQEHGLPFPDASLASLEIATLPGSEDARALLLREAYRVLKGKAELRVKSSTEGLPALTAQAIMAGFLERSEDAQGGLRASKRLDAEDLPLVSIVTPSYKVRYFAQALASACAQSYPNIEIIVCDNCPTEAIREVSEHFAELRPLTYYRNPKKLLHNFQTCFDMAKGQYIKFLLDDDLLDPDCVRRMLLPFEAYGDEISLVTSYRQRIDPEGLRLPDDSNTSPIQAMSGRIPGRIQGDRMLLSRRNSIGEHSTTLFRRADLADHQPFFFSWAEHEYQGLGDVSIALKLLSQGDLYYYAESLSSFRTHPAQNTFVGNLELRVTAVLEWSDLVLDGRRSGYLKDDNEYAEALRRVRKFLRRRKKPFLVEPELRRRFDEAEARLSEAESSLSGGLWRAARRITKRR